jgi:hypothetical protein
MLMEKKMGIRGSPAAAFKKAYTTFPSLNSSSVWKTMSPSSKPSSGGIGPRLALSLPPLMDMTCCWRVCFRAVPAIEAGLTSRRGPRCVRGRADASNTRIANKNHPILISDYKEAGVLQNFVRQLSPKAPDLGQPVSSLVEARMDGSQRQELMTWMNALDDSSWGKTGQKAGHKPQKGGGSSRGSRLLLMLFL